MHKGAAHHPLTNACAAVSTPGHLPPAPVLGTTPWGVEYPSGQPGSAALATHRPTFLYNWLLAEHGKQKNPELRISAA